MDKFHLIITCEHGGNKIPPEYQPLFRNYKELLNSHRGYDHGAIDLAQFISNALNTSLFFSTNSRLLIDLNRSVGHRQLFSDITKPLDPSEKENIIRRYHTPYREKIVSRIMEKMNVNQSVLHISQHSFTPVLNNQIRKADIGILYDPQRMEEKHFCLILQKKIQTYATDVIVRRNYPYRGTSDGLTAYFRKIFRKNYLGIELEVNQKWVDLTNPAWNSMKNSLLRALKDSLAETAIH